MLLHRLLNLGVGTLLGVVGVAVRPWAIHTLAFDFRRDVQVDRQQLIVDEGPTRFIRHPAYPGFLLTGLAMGLAMQSMFAMMILLVPVLLTVLCCIHVEDDALHRTIGDAYVAYMTRTKRLLPLLF